MRLELGTIGSQVKYSITAQLCSTYPQLGLQTSVKHEAPLSYGVYRPVFIYRYDILQSFPHSASIITPTLGLNIGIDVEGLFKSFLMYIFCVDVATIGDNFSLSAGFRSCWTAEMDKCAMSSEKGILSHSRTTQTLNSTCINYMIRSKPFI